MFSRRFFLVVLSRALAAAALMLGAAVLFGWLGGHAGLKAPLAGFPAMKPNTALALVLAGGMCLATGTSARVRRLGQAFAAALLLLALAQWVQAVRGLDLRIDELLFRDDTGFGAPGRMPTTAAYHFMALACARLLLDSGRKELRLIGAGLSGVSLIIALAIGLAYIDWVRSSDGLPMLFTMAPHTVLGAALVAASLVAAHALPPWQACPTRQRCAVLLSFGLTAVLAGLAWGYVTWTDYADTRLEAATWTQNLARVLNEHVRRSLDTPDLVLDQLESDIDRDGLQSVVQSRIHWERLRAIVERSPQISSIGLLDARGDLLLLSSRFPSPGGNYAYRDYFKAHAAGVHTHIGPVIVAGASGKLIFTFSRRLEDGEGRFAGVLLASMDVAYYRNVFDSLDLPSGSAVALLTAQGRFLVREPMNGEVRDVDLSGEPLFTRYASLARGTFVGHFALDSEDRLLSFQRAEDLGLVVVASLGMEKVTATFERRMVGTVLILMGVLAALGAGTRVQLRGIGREEENLTFVSGVLNSVGSHIAILDAKGCIVETNEAWNRFARENGASDPRGFLGRNYFEVCRAASQPGSAELEEVMAGIASVMRRMRPEFVHVYRCDSPTESRWFNLRVTPLAGRHGSVVLSHENITELKRAEEAVRRLAHTDPLTGLANRRAFFETAERESARVARYSGALSVIALDIDHFKRVNDTHGHEAGDRVLETFARTLEAQCRSCDLVARFGGEEFVILLPETPQAGALLLAERIRRSVAAGEIVHGDVVIRITVSSGVAQYAPDREGLNELLARADGALYAAKEGGRNRVEPAAAPGGVPA